MSAAGSAPAGPPGGGGSAGPGSPSGDPASAVPAGGDHQPQNGTAPPQGADPPRHGAGEPMADPASSSKPELGPRTGTGAARREALGDAQHVIDGDLVGRDKLVFLLGGEQQAPLRPISPFSYEPVQRAFVEPPNWAALRDHVLRRRIVVLRGYPGAGRTAAAIRLLGSIGTSTIYELDPRVDLGRLADQLDRELRTTIDQGATFLLSQPADTTVVGGRVLRELDGVLERAGSTLVVTVGPDARFTDVDDMGCLAELAGPPDLREVVRRHLEWRFEDRPADVLPEQAITRAVEEFVGEVDTCERAARLAFLIREEVGDGTEAISLDRIRARMARRDLDAFDTWFADLRDVRSRAFAIALASLDGAPYEDVARASENLRRRLEPPPAATIVERDDAPPPDRRRHFALPRRVLLEQLRAGVVETEIWRDYGRTPAHRVSFRDRAYPRRVISHVWLEYQIHDVLIDWLADLARDPSEPVRVLASSTLGVISTYSFHHVLTSVVHEWAGSADAREREAVACLLRVPAGDPRLAPTVRDLVDGWLGGEDPEWVATAVRTLGLSWLRSETADTVAKIARVVRSASWTVVTAVALSFIDLLEADAVRFARGVLITLLTWFDDRETRDTASLTFLLVAHDLEEEVPQPDGTTVRWPGLLRLATSTESVRDPLVRCWCRTLAQGSDTDIAEQVLDGWAKLAERDRTVRDALTRLAWVIGATDRRALEILRRRVRHWRDPTTLFPLPATAAALHSVLELEGHHAGTGSADREARPGHLPGPRPRQDA